FDSYFCFEAEDGIRDRNVTGVQTCALPILELAKEVVALAESGKADFAPIYASELTLKEKIATVAREIYGAGDVVYAKEAETALRSEERRVGKGKREERTLVQWKRGERIDEE